MLNMFFLQKMADGNGLLVYSLEQQDENTIGMFNQLKKMYSFPPWLTV